MPLPLFNDDLSLTPTAASSNSKEERRRVNKCSPPQSWPHKSIPNVSRATAGLTRFTSAFRLPSSTSGDGRDRVCYIRGCQRPSLLHLGMAEAKSGTSGDGRDRVRCIRGWQSPSRLHPSSVFRLPSALSRPRLDNEVEPGEDCGAAAGQLWNGSSAKNACQ